jgi:hypothetical protein
MDFFEDLGNKINNEIVKPAEKGFNDSVFTPANNGYNKDIADFFKRNVPSVDQIVSDPIGVINQTIRDPPIQIDLPIDLPFIPKGATPIQVIANLEKEGDKVLKDAEKVGNTVLDGLNTAADGILKFLDGGKTPDGGSDMTTYLMIAAVLVGGYLLL